MVGDAAQALRQGQNSASVAGTNRVDIATSTAPYIVIVDRDNHILASSMVLAGRQVAPPAGVMDHARTSGDNRVTWQLRPGIRQALVAVGVGNGRSDVIVAGRSLLETERLISTISYDVGILWLVGLFGTFLVTLLAEWLRRSGPSSE